MKKTSYISFFITLLCSVFLFAQEPERNDDLGDVSDAFQTNFYDAIQQKGIENYDKAIDLLINCKLQDPENAAVYFELGKNYLELDKLQLAANALLKANQLKPNNEWVLNTLLQLYKNKKEQHKAIAILKKLGALKSKYKEKLAYYYVTNGMYAETLALVDALDQEKGIVYRTEQYRYRSYQATKKYKEQIAYISGKIANQTATEYDYTQLIYSYSRLKDNTNSFKIMQDFAKAYPNSDKPLLGLYKYYIQQNEINKAITILHKVTTSSTLVSSEKYKVLNDFYNFTKKNIAYLPELEKALQAYPHKTVAKKMIGLYDATNNTQKSDRLIEDAIKNTPTQFTELKDLITVLLKKKQYDNALKVSSKALDLYPAQPIFYLQKATALNESNSLKKAIENLELGQDYIIDNNKMLSRFYAQMARAYQLQNDLKNQKKYLQKAKKTSL